MVVAALSEEGRAGAVSAVGSEATGFAAAGLFPPVTGVGKTYTPGALSVPCAGLLWLARLTSAGLSAADAFCSGETSRVKVLPAMLERSCASAASATSSLVADRRDTPATVDCLTVTEPTSGLFTAYSGAS